MALFTDTDALIEQSYHMMMILGVGYIAMEVTQCLQGVMRGAGDTMAPMWLSMITTVVIRVPLAYLMTGMTKSAESSRRVLHDVRIAADHMAHRRHTDNDRVQSRQVEAESAHLILPALYNI